MSRLLYTLSILALMPWAVLHLLWRARRQPEYLRHWGERFGRLPAATSAAPTIWIHAVSVGETRAAQPLVKALREHYPGYRILLTHMTPTGRATSKALFGDEVDRVYLPYDLPWAVKAFLTRYRPALGLIMETELWPNLIAACNRRRVPLLLVNGRLSARSARRYARFPKLSRQALRGLAAIAAQGEEDAARLQNLGAGPVAVLGNMKFDVTPPEHQLALGLRFRQWQGARPVFLCASTREGEEALILSAWPRNTPALLVIVPRHPQRFAEVETLAADMGFSVSRRSSDMPIASSIQVWIGDSMGEMFGYYAAADAAFIGGSLLDFGAQNLIEPAAVGVPVLIGPSTYNFAEVAREAIAAGAARQVANAGEMVDAALGLLEDEAQRRLAGEAGRAFTARHRGATRRTLELVETFLPNVGR